MSAVKLIEFLPDFFPRNQAIALAEAARVANGMPSGIEVRGDKKIRDTFRRSTRCDVEHALTPLTDHIRMCGPVFAALFNCHLTGCQPIEVLRYEPGGHFRMHADRTGEPDQSDLYSPQARQLSLVVFLSEEHEGGELRFYDHSAIRMARDPMFDTVPRIGDAVVFRSDIFHCVTPVTAGTRVTAIGWYV